MYAQFIRTLRHSIQIAFTMKTLDFAPETHQFTWIQKKTSIHACLFAHFFILFSAKAFFYSRKLLLAFNKCKFVKQWFCRQLHCLRETTEGVKRKLHFKRVDGLDSTHHHDLNYFKHDITLFNWFQILLWRWQRFVISNHLFHICW